jgi:GNAT superfamily N-acetyltransferase
MKMELISQIEGRHLDDLMGLYRQGWWSKDRSMSDVERMLQHTDLVIGLVDTDHDQLVGFARVLTDYTYFALLLDVIVASEHRHTGLGSRLLEAIKQHPPISDVEYLELCCPEELAPFYQSAGFSPVAGRMQLKRSKTV